MPRPQPRGRGLTIEHRLLLSLTLGLLSSGAAVAEPPMSAIDWLSTSVSVARPGNGSAAVLPPVAGEAPVSGVGTLENIGVASLDSPLSADSLGLLPASRIGLPRGLWGATPEVDLAAALRKERLDTLPAVQGFLLELMLAELDPPITPAPEGKNVLFLARIDRLLDLGALDQAMALLEQAEPSDPEIFRRRFDVALLLGQEDHACEIMEKSPAVAPSYPARIYCLARRSNWDAAMLTLGTGQALGQIDSETATLLQRFLDDAGADGAPDLPPPARPNPLSFRLMEAVGQPMATTTLPVAFAHSDLRANAGWKTQLEAAERLTRMGVLDPNQLLGLYTQDRASASGGVWDRVTLISQLDSALSASDAGRVDTLLPQAWAVMQDQELETAFAEMFAPRLQNLPLTGDAKTLALRMALLTSDFDKVAQSWPDAASAEPLLIAVARGDTSQIPAQDLLALTVKRVFDAPPKAVPEAYATLVPDRLGEALLSAVDDISEGAKGDPRRLEAGLALLRKVGLENLARRTALQLIILERRG